MSGIEKDGGISGERTFNPTLPLPFQVSQLSSMLAAQARAIIARHGDLTLPQWRIIRLVSMDVARGSTAIRKALGFDKGQFSKTVNVLVEKGYIELLPWASDRRQFDIALTESGQAALDSLAPDLDRRNEHLLAALTPEQRSQIHDALAALAQAAATIDFLETEPDGKDRHYVET